MPNVAQVLKDEIRRIARREIRTVCDPLKDQVRTLKDTVKAQKETITRLEKTVSALNGQAASDAGKPESAEDSKPKLRITPGWVKRQRTRLKLSQRELGKVMDVSTNTVVRWEAGTSKPRATHLENFAKLRTLGVRAVKKLLEK